VIRAAWHTEVNRRIAPHVAERHDQDWHREWDRRHVHVDHHRCFVFIGGYWCGLNEGLFPWDFYPLYGYDYYPYDYYADREPYRYINPPMHDPTVSAVQARLIRLGYYRGPVDGIFGPSTRDAVANYQIAKNLNVTGSLAPDTLRSLGLPNRPRVNQRTNG
jgi:hypothetical protein